MNPSIRATFGMLLLTGASEISLAQSENSTLYSLALSSLGVSATAAILETLPASAELVVESVQKVGHTSVVVAKATAKGVKISFEMGGELAGEVSMATGKVIKVTTNSAGYLLETSGKILAFIPNELGRSLIHHRELR